MKFLLEDEISGRSILVTNAQNITDYLRHLGKDLNDRLTEMKVVPLNHFYDLLELPRIPLGDDVGWVFNPWIHVNISASSVHRSEELLPKLILHFDPLPEPWETVADSYDFLTQWRSRKASYAEAMEYIRETYLKNRKENNMGPEKKMGVAAYIIGKNNGDWMKVVIKKVIFNDPATIVFWSDGTKTVVKAGPNDIFDPEKGLAMAISKKVLGNNYKAYGRFKKWLPKEYNNAASEK